MLSWAQMGTDFPGGSDGKESALNVGDLGLIPGWGRSPGEGNGSPLQYPCLENSMDKRSLAGYSPGGRKESGTIERPTHTDGDTLFVFSAIPGVGVGGLSPSCQVGSGKMSFRI